MRGEPAAESLAIREAAADDFAAIAEIYGFHVLNGTATFEVDPPDADTLSARWAAVRADGLPYLVAEVDGRVRGFAYAAPFRPRAAYRYTIEDSVYVADGWARRGIGSRLIETLIARCTALGRRQMIAVIGDSANVASIGFHAGHGFRVAGTLPAIGFKLGRWVDGVLMVRPLGPGDRAPPDRA